jgi:hypothetical protein
MTTTHTRSTFPNSNSNIRQPPWGSSSSPPLLELLRAMGSLGTAANWLAAACEGGFPPGCNGHPYGFVRPSPAGWRPLLNSPPVGAPPPVKKQQQEPQRRQEKEEQQKQEHREQQQTKRRQEMQELEEQEKNRKEKLRRRQKQQEEAQEERKMKEKQEEERMMKLRQEEELKKKAQEERKLKEKQEEERMMKLQQEEEKKEKQEEARRILLLKVKQEKERKLRRKREEELKQKKMREEEALLLEPEQEASDAEDSGWWSDLEREASDAEDSVQAERPQLMPSFLTVQDVKAAAVTSTSGRLARDAWAMHQAGAPPSNVLLSAAANERPGSCDGSAELATPLLLPTVTPPRTAVPLPPPGEVHPEAAELQPPHWPKACPLEKIVVERIRWHLLTSVYQKAEDRFQVRLAKGTTAASRATPGRHACRVVPPSSLSKNHLRTQNGRMLSAYLECFRQDRSCLDSGPQGWQEERLRDHLTEAWHLVAAKDRYVLMNDFEWDKPLDFEANIAVFTEVAVAKTALHRASGGCKETYFTDEERQKFETSELAFYEKFDLMKTWIPWGERGDRRLYEA